MIEKIFVKNLNGTSEQRPPFPVGSWLDWWKLQTGKNVRLCKHCGKPVEVGAHVKRLDSAKRYIVPLCHACNQLENPFEVPEDALALISGVKK